MWQVVSKAIGHTCRLCNIVWQCTFNIMRDLEEMVVFLYQNMMQFPYLVLIPVSTTEI